MTKRLIASFVLFLSLLSGTAWACGPEVTFRAYLDKRFWQPFAKYEDAILKAGLTNHRAMENQTCSQGRHHVPAGFSDEPASEALQKARRAFAGDLYGKWGTAVTREERATSQEVPKAYTGRAYDEIRAELAAAGKAGLTGSELDELRLVSAKLDLRMAERAVPRDLALVAKAQAGFEAFLATAQTAEWKSEARGWLARTHYLQGRYSAAVKIYLDELERRDTVFTTQSLVASLHMIFPYNGSGARLADHLEEYFDTPAHALFVVYIVTNPVHTKGEERNAMGRVGRAVIGTLQNHAELFNGSDLSDLLALALMRASMYMGDTEAALTYSRKISPGSKTAEASEFNWMVGACHFLRAEYAEAEIPLLKVAQSEKASSREFRAAARGLMGVYQKLGRPVDELRAGFLYEKTKDRNLGEPIGLYQFAAYLPDWEWLLDAPYLLDVQLTDDELRQYLARHGEEARKITYTPSYERQRTAYEAVLYELAVRAARQEKYEDAAKIYEKLNARPRAERMRSLVDLYKNATDPSLPAVTRMEAEYEYASFLEAHPTGVFFNDMVWKGFQTWAFMEGNPGTESQGLTGEERDHFLAVERRLRDEQEERWRAYGILASVIDRAGHSELGKRAAIKAIRCLDLIALERFGRKDEINQNRAKLLKWLHDYKKHAGKDKKSLICAGG